MHIYTLHNELLLYYIWIYTYKHMYMNTYVWKHKKSINAHIDMKKHVQKTYTQTRRPT